MTLSRIPLLVFVCSVAGYPAAAVAQFTGPASSPTLSIAINEFTTRVQVPALPDAAVTLRIESTYGPSLYFCKYASDIGFLTAERLRQRLLQNVSGKTASQIQSLIQQAGNEGDRVKKFALVFNYGSSEISGLASRINSSEVQDPYLNPLSQLRMGQEFRVGGPACYTGDQVDAMSAEGLRVIQAVAQQLPSGAPAQLPGPAVTPGTRQLTR